MKFRILLVPALLGCASLAASADEVEVNLSNDTAYLQYASPMEYNGYGRTDLEVGALYTETDDLLGSIGIAMLGEVGSDVPGLSFGLAIKAYAVKLDVADATLGAITLGGKARYSPPSADRFAVLGYVNYAPTITTFGDSENLMEVGARAEYEVLPGAAIYIGYREITTDLENGGPEVKLDDQGHVGLRISF
ncbi:MAG TPA: hypothetical protein ENK35_06895 [Candidatus Tenderia sp.]|nr:hypothetical protein [Candidatus Tenderia sp.]